MTVYYKLLQRLLQNATAVLLQNVNEVYLLQKASGFLFQDVIVSLQNATAQIAMILLQNVILQNATSITNCDSTPSDNKTIALCKMSSRLTTSLKFSNKNKPFRY